MPISYYNEAANPSSTYFLKILFKKWRGSVMKLIFFEISIYIISYFIVALIYTFLLGTEHQRNFENFVRYISKSISLIKVSFMLNIFLSLIYERFVNYFKQLPWNAKSQHLLGTHWPNQDPYQRLQRRTISRYFLVSFIIALSRISVQMKRKFPSLQSIVDQGYLFPHEKQKIENIPQYHAHPFIPLTWALAIVSKAYKDKMIESRNGFVTIVKEISNYQRKMVALFILDRINYSLVYVQVVNLSVYMYVIICILAYQNIPDIESDRSDYFNSYATLIPPFINVLELLIFLSLNKLAMSMQNPLGVDDSDFDILEVFQFNQETGRIFTDGRDFKEPVKVYRDIFLNKVCVIISQTKRSLSALSKCGNYLGSQWNINQRKRNKKSVDKK